MIEAGHSARSHGDTLRMVVARVTESAVWGVLRGALPEFS